MKQFPVFLLVIFSLFVLSFEGVTIGHASGFGNLKAEKLSDPEIQAIMENLSPDQRQKAFEQLLNRQKQGGIKKKKIGESPKKVSGGKTEKEIQEKRLNSKGEKESTSLEKKPKNLLDTLFTLKLPQFGQDMFVDAPNAFIPEFNIPVPVDYVLGPGDTLFVQLSGKAFKEHTLTIDRDGLLLFPGIGPIPVTGLSFQEFKNMLQTRVEKQLLGMNVAHITLGELRSHQVFILGDVPHPGSYTVNSLTTATNALFANGGIKPIGSLRNIQVKRQGKIVTHLDLYDLLLRGDQSSDVRLHNGDVIFVPPVGKLVAVADRVKRPGIYELKSEKTMEEVLNLAGGLLPDAAPNRVKLDRIQQRTKRILLDLDLSKPNHLRFLVQAGDMIHIPSVLDNTMNIVTLSGATTHPGKYQWHKGLRLSDILSFNTLLPQIDLSYAVVARLDKKNRSLSPLTVHLGRALQTPNSPHNITLQPEDEIRLFLLGEDRAKSMKQLVNNLQNQGRFNHREQVVSLAGHVRFPGIYPLSSGMKLKDLLNAGGNLKVNADLDYVLIVRSNQKGEIHPFSVHLNTPPGQTDGNNIVLEPQDQVLVFRIDSTSKNDFWKSGISDQEEGKNISKKASRFITGENSEEDQEMLDISSTDPLKIQNHGSGKSKMSSDRQELLIPVLAKLREQGSVNTPANIVLITGAVRIPGEYPLEDTMRVSDLIRASGRLGEPAYTLNAEITRFSTVKGLYREVGHFQIDMEKILEGSESEDILLHPHDTLQIKSVPQWSEINRVTLEGQIRFPGTYPAKTGETLAQIISRAGGVSKYAYPEGAIFLRENLKEREKKEIDVLINRLELELTQKGANITTPEEMVQRNAQMLRLESLVQRLKNNPPQGRLAIDLPVILDNVEKKVAYSEIILRDGDRLLIPQKTNEVTVLGEVFYPASHQHQAKHTLENYINLSGGYSPLANPKQIYVVKANGQVVPNQRPGSFFGTSWLMMGSSTVDVNQGDTIVVPIKVEEVAPMVLIKDITQSLMNIAVTVATLNTVGAL